MFGKNIFLSALVTCALNLEISEFPEILEYTYCSPTRLSVEYIVTSRMIFFILTFVSPVFAYPRFNFSAISAVAVEAAAHVHWVARADVLTLSIILTLSCHFLLPHRAHYPFGEFLVVCVFDVRDNFQERNPRLRRESSVYRISFQSQKYYVPCWNIYVHLMRIDDSKSSNLGDL